MEQKNLNAFFAIIFKELFLMILNLKSIFLYKLYSKLFEDMNVALINKSNQRILQEINKGYQTKAYKLVIPLTDGIENPNIVNVMFEMKDGYYAGQKHILEVKFQWGNPINHYFPFDPPLMTFKTPIWHPNISGFPGGAICLDFLKQTGMWSATCSLEGLVEMIKAMMDDPNPSSPQNPDPAAA